MQPIDDFIERSLWMEPEEFTAPLPAGVLLFEPDAESVKPLSPAPPTKFVAAETDEAAPWLRGARTPGNEVAFVVPLVKRAGAPHPDRLLIGRTEDSDIVIPHLTVSRAHGYLVPGTEPYLIDTGSRHGTFVKDERLAPNLPYPIRSGKRIRFGAVRTMFLTAERFFEYCQARLVADHAQRTIDGAIAYKP